MSYFLVLLMGLITASHDGTNLTLHVPLTWKEVSVQVEPEAEFVNTAPGVFVAHTGAVRGKVEAVNCTEDMCEFVSESFAVPGKENSFWWLALGAFGAGVLMLFAPCTLPAIGLKLAAFRGRLFPYIVGVLLAFTILGVLAAILGMGLSHMSLYWYRVALMVVCTLVGLSFLELINIPMVGTTSNNPFFLGLLSVALGSSCTVPFLAPVLVAVTVLPAWQGILLFQIMGVGFLLPFLLPIPLPKPGPWLNKFTRICGIVMLGVAAWLATTLLPRGGDVVVPTSPPYVVVVSAKWCVSCAVVTPIWSSSEALDAYSEGEYTVKLLDWTDGNEAVGRFLASYGVKGIPFAVVVRRDGSTTTFTGLYTKESVLKALK